MPDGTLDPEGELEILGLMKAEMKIPAIKRAMALTGLGLAQAKALVEGLEAAVQAARSEQGSVPSGPSDDLAARAWALKAEGKLIHAIKLVREETGMGLKESKEYVDALRPGMTAPLTPVAPPQSGPGLLSSADEERARALLLRGQKIEAIKLVREATGMGLKESKDYVEGLA